MTATAIDWFGDRPVTKNLRRRSVRGGTATLAAQTGMSVFRFGVTILLARLLLPEDFGVFALAATVIGLGDLLRDMGLAAATVQRPHITRSQINTLFWINCSLGLLITTITALAAGWLASYFDEPRLYGTMLALSFSFALGSLSIQHMALLRRKLQLVTLASVNVQVLILSSCLGLVMAWIGLGHWALIGAALASSILTTILAWHYCDWRPSRPSWDPEVWQMIDFARYLVGFSLLGYIARSLPTVLLGKTVGANAVGLYTRASRLCMKSATFITEAPRIVAIPVLSRLIETPHRFRHYYLRGLQLMVMVAAPCSIAGILFGPDAITVLLGSPWKESGDLVPLIIVSLVPQVIGNSTGWVYLGTGRSRAMMWWGVVGWSSLILCLIIGARFGMKGLALGYSISMYLTVIPALYFAFIGTAIRLRDIWFTCWRPMISAICAGAGVLALQPFLQDYPKWLELAFEGAFMGLAYATILLLGFKQWPFVRGILSELMTRRKTKRVQEASA